MHKFTEREIALWNASPKSKVTEKPISIFSNREHRNWFLMQTLSHTQKKAIEQFRKTLR